MSHYAPKQPHRPAAKPSRKRDDKTPTPSSLTSGLPPGSIMNNIKPENQVAAPPPLQPKLSIGQPGDKYEQEADRTAAQVVRQINQPVSPLQRQIAADARPSILQRLRDSAVQRSELPSPNFEQTLNRARSGGQALDAGLQQSMGTAMNADFSTVKVHTDSTANDLSTSIQAKAFTTGSDIFFKQGEYSPGSTAGQELIAHELTHTVQQGAVVRRKPSAEETITRLEQTLQPKRLDSPTVVRRQGSNRVAQLKAITSRPTAYLPRVQRQDVIQRKDDDDDVAVVNRGDKDKSDKKDENQDQGRSWEQEAFGGYDAPPQKFESDVIQDPSQQPAEQPKETWGGAYGEDGKDEKNADGQDAAQDQGEQGEADAPPKKAVDIKVEGDLSWHPQQLMCNYELSQMKKFIQEASDATGCYEPVVIKITQEKVSISLNLLNAEDYKDFDPALLEPDSRNFWGIPLPGQAGFERANLLADRYREINYTEPPYSIFFTDSIDRNVKYVDPQSQATVSVPIIPLKSFMSDVFGVEDDAYDALPDAEQEGAANDQAKPSQADFQQEVDPAVAYQKMNGFDFREQVRRVTSLGEMRVKESGSFLGSVDAKKTEIYYQHLLDLIKTRFTGTSSILKPSSQPDMNSWTLQASDYGGDILVSKSKEQLTFRIPYAGRFPSSKAYFNGLVRGDDRQKVLKYIDLDKSQVTTKTSSAIAKRMTQTEVAAPQANPENGQAFPIDPAALLEMGVKAQQAPLVEEENEIEVTELVVTYPIKETKLSKAGDAVKKTGQGIVETVVVANAGDLTEYAKEQALDSDPAYTIFERVKIIAKVLKGNADEVSEDQVTELVGGMTEAMSWAGPFFGIANMIRQAVDIRKMAKKHKELKGALASSEKKTEASAEKDNVDDTVAKLQEGLTYAISKTFKKMLRVGFQLIMNLIQTASRIITILAPGLAVGTVFADAFAQVAKVSELAVRKTKGLIKHVKGTRGKKRNESATSIFNAAIAGEPEALQAIRALSIQSVFDQGVKLLKKGVTEPIKKFNWGKRLPMRILEAAQGKVKKKYSTPKQVLQDELYGGIFLSYLEGIGLTQERDYVAANRDRIVAMGFVTEEDWKVEQKIKNAWNPDEFAKNVKVVLIDNAERGWPKGDDALLGLLRFMQTEPALKLSLLKDLSANMQS